MNTITLLRPELLQFSHETSVALRNYMWILGGGVLGMLATAISPAKAKWPVFVVTLIGLFGALFSSVMSFGMQPVMLFNGGLAADHFTALFSMLFSAAGIFTVLSSVKYLDEDGLQYPEYYILTSFSVMGMMLLSSAVDFIVLFIALEIMSLGVYTLVGFRRADRRSNEAAMKYFVLGSAASAVLLYGMALIYGSTGTMNLVGVVTAIKANSLLVNGTFMVGFVFLLAGLLFKVAAFPFHLWMPDVYEGAPIPVTGLMTTGLKAAAFAVLIRVILTTGVGRGYAPAMDFFVKNLLSISAIATMVLGNVIALTQTNLKRMLGYSSIAHTGYLLIGVLSGMKNPEMYSALPLYLISYSVMNLGAFAVLGVLATRGDSGVNLHHLAGLSRRHPFLAFALAVFLFSMAGIPPTAGFAAKYLLFSNAVQVGLTPLVVVAVLCSAISVYYYLRVLVYVYMRDAEGAEPSPIRSALLTQVTVIVMVVLTLQMGLLPSGWVEIARAALKAF